MKQHAGEAVAGGIGTGVAAATAVGAAIETDPMFIAAAIVGGVIGAGMAARKAFDENDDRAVGEIAISLAFSMAIGVSAGFFLGGAAGEMLEATRLQTVALAFLLSAAGERVVGVLVDRLVNLTKTKGGGS